MSAYDIVMPPNHFVVVEIDFAVFDVAERDIFSSVVVFDKPSVSCFLIFIGDSRSTVGSTYKGNRCKVSRDNLYIVGKTLTAIVHSIGNALSEVLGNSGSRAYGSIRGSTKGRG